LKQANISSNDANQKLNALIRKVTSVTNVQSASARMPVHSSPWWMLLQNNCVAITFRRRVWYCILYLCYVCIRSLDIILIP